MLGDIQVTSGLVGRIQVLSVTFLPLWWRAGRLEALSWVSLRESQGLTMLPSGRWWLLYLLLYYCIGYCTCQLWLRAQEQTSQKPRNGSRQSLKVQTQKLVRCHFCHILLFRVVTEHIIFKEGAETPPLPQRNIKAFAAIFHVSQ